MTASPVPGFRSVWFSFRLDVMAARTQHPVKERSSRAPHVGLHSGLVNAALAADRLGAWPQDGRNAGYRIAAGDGATERGLWSGANLKTARINDD
jgi:hypothetical protein